MIRTLFLLMFLFPLSLSSHGKSHVGKSPNVTDFTAMNEVYLREIKPIFQQKCFDCHSNQTRFPWYYRLPGAKQLIDYDRREAKEHMDLSNDFPFGGHHSPQEQLEDIGEVVKKNKMPLWRYRLLHQGSGLTDEEQRRILEWVGR